MPTPRSAIPGSGGRTISTSVALLFVGLTSIRPAGIAIVAVFASAPLDAITFVDTVIAYDVPGANGGSANAPASSSAAVGGVTHCPGSGAQATTVLTSPAMAGLPRIAPAIVVPPPLAIVIVYAVLAPLVTAAIPSSMLMARSSGGGGGAAITVSVSLVLSFAAVASKTPAGAPTLAVVMTLPLAALSTSAEIVYVTMAPGCSVAVVSRLPMPPGVPHAVTTLPPLPESVTAQDQAPNVRPAGAVW